MCVIIIGAGPAGCEAAYRLAQAGETVELIEKESETGRNLVSTLPRPETSP